MRFDVITIFPQLVEAFADASLLGRARDKELLSIAVHDLRSFSGDRHKTVDDEPYGGGGGMVMTAPPWLAAVRQVDPDHRALRLLMSPQGRRLDESLVRQLAGHERLLLMCGRYEGIDERVRELVVDQEVSIGDYVLSGGEVAAMVVIETVSRQIEGVVGLASSVDNDSFRSGLLDYPHYTRPSEVEGSRVPDVLLSGNHAEIERWRRLRALAVTLEKRPDLLNDLERRGELTPEQRLQLDRWARERDRQKPRKMGGKTAPDLQDRGQNHDN